MDKILATIPVNSFDEIRFQIIEYKGRSLMDVRVFSTLKEGDEKVPTGKGIAIDAGSFPQFKQAVLTAEQVLMEMKR